MRSAGSARPGTPPQQRWFVDADSWDRDRVITACRRWAAETGGPPSYYDWGPQDRVPAGVSTVLADKWESEHPVWPSRSVVYRHVGGMRKLRLEAGFAAPEPPELPLAERVATAQRLHSEGLPWAEIADLLGVTPRTARSYGSAHDCAACGRPIVAVAPKLCGSCALRGHTRWGRPFTQDEIVAAIRVWAELEGRPPAQIDWRPVVAGGHPRWERDCPRFPPVSHVTRRFGSWNKALQAAEFDRPRPPSWSDSEILDALRQWAHAHSKAPLSTEWDRSPDAGVISKRFGSWNTALLAAGLEPRVVRRRDWTDEEIVTGLQRLADDLGRHPRSTDRVGSRGIFPSPALAIQRFGSWRRALLAAGLEPGNPPPTTDRRVVDALREYHRKHGCSPTTTSWKAVGGLPAADTIIRHCGSWRAAIELAELPVPQRAQRGPSDDGVIAALREYRDELDVAPTMAAWRKQHRQPGVKLIRNRFGTWEQALARAGISQ
jgi:hypothetical protein